MARLSSIEYLEKLVAFATVSRDSNLELIEYVKSVLEPLGFSCLVVPSADGRKANLYASTGPADIPGVVLSGHSDVVPVEGQAWSSDPFVLRAGNGRLYGRGSVDMKGFIACCLHAAHDIRADKLSVPLHFAFSYDEEIGCIGVRRLIDLMEGFAVKPRFCIIGEPTSMQVVTAHKGKVSFHVECTGLEAHSSMAPMGINAIHLACDMISAIRREQDHIAETGHRDGDYDVPYTTLHAGNIKGGEAMNIVPNRCAFDFEIRHIPGDDAGEIVARLEARRDEIVAIAAQKFSGAAINFTPLVSYPALDTPVDSQVVAFVKSLTGANATGKISFGTEGGLFQSRLGIATVVCGPGSIAVAHKPDEYIEESQMAACEDFLSKLIAHVS